MTVFAVDEGYGPDGEVAYHIVWECEPPRLHTRHQVTAEEWTADGKVRVVKAWTKAKP